MQYRKSVPVRVNVFIVLVGLLFRRGKSRSPIDAQRFEDASLQDSGCLPLVHSARSMIPQYLKPGAAIVPRPHREGHRCGDEPVWWLKVRINPMVKARDLWLKTLLLMNRPKAAGTRRPFDDNG